MPPFSTGSASATVKRHLHRQLDADGLAVIQLHQGLHPVLQEARLVLADEIDGQLDLVVGLHVHEGQHVAAGEQELEVLLVEMDFVHRLVGAEALVQLGAVVMFLSSTWL